ncbi:MAG: tetratricopeptide repeat protein [Anaerolineales bacterium]|nr:tetratricopeptide repeat protein [Anaerolineales bacterium]
MEFTDFDALWNYDQPAETEARFQALLPETAAAPARRAELLTQIARAQGLQRRFAEAHQTLDEVDRALTAEMRRARVRCLLERGRVFNSSRQPERAVPLFRAAWEQAQAADEAGLAVDAAHMLGIAAPTPDEQLAWNQRALDLAERSPDPAVQHWRGPLYNNLGWTYHDRGEYTRALELFERAVAWRAAQNQPRPTRIARWCVARALRSLGRLTEALAGQQALLAEAEAAGEPDGYIYEELAECLLALGRPEAARPYFAQAHALLAQEAWLAEAEPARLERLRTLGAPAA